MTFATCAAAVVDSPGTALSEQVNDAWFSDDEYSEQPRSVSVSQEQPTFIEDPRVARLVTGDFDEPDELIGELQSSMKEGNNRLTWRLLQLASWSSLDPDTRSLLLETVAGARLRLFEKEVLEAIRSALDAAIPRLQFGAIAAASDLPRSYRISLGRVVREIATAPETHHAVKRAAEAYLRRRV